MIPKFRVWDKYKGIMYAVEGIDFIELSISVRDEDVPKYFKTLYLDDSIVLMQSTGLKDINGVEIYEGDILRADKKDGAYRNAIGVCTYDDLEGGYHVNENWLQAFVWDTATSFPKTALEVIGNIYENEELLEKTK